MKIDRRLGNILLAIYLILAGLAAFGVNIPFANIIMGICALIAGIIFLISPAFLTRNLEFGGVLSIVEWQSCQSIAAPKESAK